jgi:uroporphyrinogen-III synthase
MSQPQRVLVVRAAHQSDRLSTKLRNVGLIPVTVPVIDMVPPDDEGVALRAALGCRYDWVAYTSSNAVAAVATFGSVSANNIAAIGPGTSEAVRQRGNDVTLEASISTAEGLAAELLNYPVGSILLPLAAAAGTVVADQLTLAGWEVTSVIAYQTVPRTPSETEMQVARTCDAIVFTSSSSVSSWCAVCSVDETPALVVSIGPQTTQTAKANGLSVSVEASPHTLDGLVTALVRALGSGSDSRR